MKKKNERLSGGIYIITGSEKKLWYTLDEEQHTEFILSKEETERIKAQFLDRIKNMN